MPPYRRTSALASALVIRTCKMHTRDLPRCKTFSPSHIVKNYSCCEVKVRPELTTSKRRTKIAHNDERGSGW